MRECQRCQSINPAPVCHEGGELSVGRNWELLAIAVTLYKNRLFLSVVDCGPGRFAIWREMYNETAGIIVKNLEQILFERGPVHEMLMDNATAFKSKLLREFLNKCNVSPYYRAAYRASGNGIVERHHRTIK